MLLCLYITIKHVTNRMESSGNMVSVHMFCKNTTWNGCGLYKCRLASFNLIQQEILLFAPDVSFSIPRHGFASSFYTWIHDVKRNISQNIAIIRLI